MSCADDAILWQYQDDALDAEARAALEAHLASCDRCTAALSGVRATRRVLKAASGQTPSVSWRRADDQVLQAVRARMTRAGGWRVSGWGFAGVTATLAVIVVIWSPWRQVTPAPGPERDVGAPMMAGVTVEAAVGATVTWAEGNEALSAGGGVRAGTVIHTDPTGSATLRLPEQSLARLESDTRATVARATVDEVRIDLGGGAVVVRAAHVPRKAFLVDAERVQVRVVGTAFRVVRTAEAIVVSVAEGKVLVEPVGGESRLVEAGRRVTIGADGTFREDRAIGEEDAAAFATLGIAVGVRAQGPARAEPPPPAPPQPAPAPSARVEVPRTRGGGIIEAAVNPPAPKEEIAAAPEAPAPEEWKTPEFKEAEPVGARSPGLAERAKANGLPITAEGLFLQRAEEALKSGHCQNYLPGLQEVVEGSELMNTKERALILRARCFDEQLEPTRAAAEYRRYLDRFPSGRFADEARRALEYE